MEREVAPNLQPGTKVRITATQAPGAIVREHPGAGYEVHHPGGLHSFAYDQLALRGPGTWSPTSIATFTQPEHVPTDWLPGCFPYDAGPALAGQRRLIVQTVGTLDDVHDVRAALLVDPELKVLVAYQHTDDAAANQAHAAELTAMCEYYDGVPHYARRVAVVGGAADRVRHRFGGLEPAAAIDVLHHRKRQHGAGYLDARLERAIGGERSDDDDFDCVRELVARGFAPNEHYVLVDVQGMDAHALATGAQGFWDLMRCAIAAGYTPVPLGPTPGIARWPGPSLAELAEWPVCRASARRNQRQAEHYLLSALHRFNPNVRALAWRGGRATALAYVGIPVLALDVADAGGHARTASREQLVLRYARVELTDRAAAEQGVGVAGWLGALPHDEQVAVCGALGVGPYAGHLANLFYTPPPVENRFGPTPPPEMLIAGVRRFIASLRRIGKAAPSHALVRAVASLAVEQRGELVAGVAYARLAAMWDITTIARAHVAQPPGTAHEHAPKTVARAMTTVAHVGAVIAYAAQGAVASERASVDVLARLDDMATTLELAVHRVMLAQRPATPAPVAQTSQAYPPGPPSGAVTVVDVTPPPEMIETVERPAVSRAPTPPPIPMRARAGAQTPAPRAQSPRGQQTPMPYAPRLRAMA